MRELLCLNEERTALLAAQKKMPGMATLDAVAPAERHRFKKVRRLRGPLGARVWEARGGGGRAKTSSILALLCALIVDLWICICR